MAVNTGVAVAVWVAEDDSVEIEVEVWVAPSHVETGVVGLDNGLGPEFPEKDVERPGILGTES